MGDAASRHCSVLAGDIRKLDVSVEVGVDRKLKRMLEVANKIAARYTLIVGDNEIVTQTYSLKNMADRRAGNADAPAVVNASWRKK